MFEKLKIMVAAQADARKANARFYIENGYCESWAEENRKPGDDGIRRYCTSRRWDQYQTGEITREQIVGYTIKRMEKQQDKYTAEKLNKLAKAEAAANVEYVTIHVDWKHNRTWGYNPTATVVITSERRRETFTGTASGCGYDKLTAAIGSALNQSDCIKRMLYAAKEKALEAYTGGQIREMAHADKTLDNRDFINYGAGYGVLPYFEGGVGMISFYGVFKACGLGIVDEHETRLTNYYRFEKGGR